MSKQIVLPGTYNKLPEWQIRAAILHGTSYAEDVEGLKPDDKNWAKTIEKEAVKYLKSGIEESLTPHMTGGDNPTSAIAEDVFKLSPVFAIDGLFLSRVSDKDAREIYYRRIRAALNSLAGVYADIALKYAKSKFAIAKGAGKEETRETKVAQYERAFLDTAMAALLESVFRANPKGFDEFIRQGLEGKNLSDPAVREEFIKKVRDQVTREGFNAASLQKIFS